MENAPLTLAYAHARNAAQETKRSNPVAASEEHDLAAAEFAAAAQTAKDEEALRVLRLLEQHHRQLGQILKDMHSKPTANAEPDKNTSTSTAVAREGMADNAKPKSTDASKEPPRLARTGRSTARDLSSSIASNLASARGIPANRQRRTIPVSPLISNEHADGTFSQDPGDQKRVASESNSQQSSRPSWAPPESVTPKASTDSAASDAPFHKFYSKFEGLISTLTAPLAFASLPLTQPAMPEKEASKVQIASQPPRKVSAKADPSAPALDYSQLISNAALRAVRDNNDTGYPKPHESFLLVPTSGGTMSYADITAQAYIDRQVNRQQHRQESSATSDDFVAASSQVIAPSSLTHASSTVMRPSTQQQYHGKSMEELHLENKVLRRTTNDIAKRLQAFEMSAQTSSAALAQSVRSLHLSPVTTPENSHGKAISMSGKQGELGMRMAQKRIEDLEEVLRKYERKITKRDEENLKLKDTLGKYREKWEGLKAGAKARREQAGAGQRRGSSATAVPSTAPIAEAKEGEEG